MPQTYDAIVVGAGHNGLVTAAYLAPLRAEWKLFFVALDKLAGVTRA